MNAVFCRRLFQDLLRERGLNIVSSADSLSAYRDFPGQGLLLNLVLEQGADRWIWVSITGREERLNVSYAYGDLFDAVNEMRQGQL